jgi:hypothetical protein
MLIGRCLNFTGVNPIRFLFDTADGATPPAPASLSRAG